MGETAKRGRPKGSVAEQTREIPVQFVAFAQEKDAYKAAAQRDGLSLSAWIRFQLNKVVRGG